MNCRSKNERWGVTVPMRMWVWLFAIAPFSAIAATSSSDVQLQVDVSRSTGPLTYAYRAGVFLNSLPVGYPKDMFLAEQRPGMVELSLDFYEPLLNAASEVEFFARLPQSNLTAWVRGTAAAGGEPYIRLMPVPKWLRSGRDGARKPPRDLEGWGRFVERLVEYFNNQLRIDVRYIVWDEPDGFWEGTTEEYLQLYRHAAAGLLRANPKARIGGPATASFTGAIGKGSPPLLPAFVNFCATTPLPGLARRLPLDILVWHSFDAAPVSPGQYDLEVAAARALLKKHGYEGVELNVGSWAPLEQYAGLANTRDSEFLGAFVVASVIAMERAGVGRHAFFNLFEDWRRNRDEFSNDMGLTTRSYVVKSGYNAYRLLGRLQGSQVFTQVPDPFIQATAARGNRTLRVLVANFVPPPRMLLTLAQKRLMAGGHSRDEIKKIAPNPKQLLRDRRQIEALNAPPDMRATALALHDAAQVSARRQHEPVGLQVTVQGLPAGRYRLREYRIDGKSANAYAQREAIERSLQKAPQESRGAVKDYLSQRWSAAEMAQLSKLIAAGGDVATRLRTLPPDQQRDAQAAFVMLQEAKHRQVQVINTALQPREQNVSEVSVQGNATWRTSLPPYGVMLLEAERID